MALGVGTDFMTAVPMIVIGALSGSLTLLADAMRRSLLTLLELFAFLMLRRIHRGRLPYDPAAERTKKAAARAAAKRIKRQAREYAA